jgi:RHH-type proline utilization regulon transcriptional repressor/proline dehydrogenase/delta 1-pyrroline-5-carboxylate dehydrogenase
VRVINHPDIEFTPDIIGAGIQALLFAGTTSDAAPLQRSLADREGTMIVPLVTERQDGGYDLYRLVAEKVVSINTTAAGGNASLMSL